MSQQTATIYIREFKRHYINVYKNIFKVMTHGERVEDSVLKEMGTHEH